VDVHPNTVRLYEEWGFLPTIPRSPSGYRRFTQVHLDQMRLARSAMQFTWMGGNIRDTAREVIFSGAVDDLGGALEAAYRLLVLIQGERSQAEAAADYLERWAKGAQPESMGRPLWIGETARRLAVTTDQLRNWERNGLIQVPRNPENGYRMYGGAQIGRLRVIRTLASAKYSQMSILRMVLHLDGGQREALRQILDTPRDDEDAYYATDRSLASLADMEKKSRGLIALIEELIQKRGSR